MEEKDPFEEIEQSGKTIVEIMGEMMEHGYIVTGTEGNVSLKKIATESDPKTIINNKENSHSIDGILTKAHAVAVYLRIRDLEEIKPQKLISWQGTALYYIGKYPQFYYKNVEAYTPEEAKDMVIAQTKEFFNSNPELHGTNYKEVKVKPIFTEE